MSSLRKNSQYETEINHKNSHLVILTFFVYNNLSLSKHKISIIMSKTINGFSKLTKLEKIEWLASNFFNNDVKVKQILMQYWNSNPVLQDLHDDFIENTISNFYLPFGIAPNFVINGKDYTIPMAIEESSVVAAASLVAKFWSTRGGFKAKVISTVKVGQVNYMFNGDKLELEN